MFVAGVAHPVERHLAKVEVASSSLVTRSMRPTGKPAGLPFPFFCKKSSFPSLQTASDLI